MIQKLGSGFSSYGSAGKGDESIHVWVRVREFEPPMCGKRMGEWEGPENSDVCPILKGYKCISEGLDPLQIN